LEDAGERVRLKGVDGSLRLEGVGERVRLKSIDVLIGCVGGLKERVGLLVEEFFPRVFEGHE